jgi:hypothetical protein
VADVTPPATLVIGHGNVHATNHKTGAMVKVIRSSGAASFGLNEAHRVIHPIGRRLRRTHRVTIAPVHGKPRATPILTRRTLAATTEGAKQISRAASPEKWAPARWMTWSGYDHPIGRVAHINVHLNAQVNADLPATHPRAQEYVRSLAALGHMIDLLARTDHIVIVSGDVNLTDAHEGKVPAARRVRAMLRRHGLTVKGQGVDVIAVPHGYRLAVDVIPGDRVGSDHPWLIGTVKRR